MTNENRIDPEYKKKIIDLIRLVVTHPQSKRDIVNGYMSNYSETSYRLGDVIITFVNNSSVHRYSETSDFNFNTEYWPKEDKEDLWNQVRHFAPYKRTVDDVTRALLERFPLPADWNDRGKDLLQ